MSGTSSSLIIDNSTPRVPKLFAQVNNYLSLSPIAQLGNGYPSGDPTADGLYDWRNPNLTLFTRDMTPEILAMNPVLVLRRLNVRATNYNKNYKNGHNSKRHVTPGNSSNNGLQFHGGDSSTNRAGTPIPEIDNFIPILNYTSVGYNRVMFDAYELPVKRFVKDTLGGGYNFGDQIARAIYVPEFNDSVFYSRQSNRHSNNVLKFELVLAVPNPNWTARNHQNRWIFGEGQTILVEPRLQTFNDGGGNLEYYIGWMTRAVN